jgi:hypothetical protein
VPGFGAKANITVTIDFNDLKAATANTTGHLVHGDAFSAATIRRLACDARILPLVLGSNSEPLDVGRSERLVTRAMRRALNARDKGCEVVLRYRFGAWRLWVMRSRWRLLAGLPWQRRGLGTGGPSVVMCGLCGGRSGGPACCSWIR